MGLNGTLECSIAEFGLDRIINKYARANNATIEVIIEDGNFNNSLAGALNCPNAYPKSTGNEARNTWNEIYLQDGRSTWLDVASLTGMLLDADILNSIGTLQSPD